MGMCTRAQGGHRCQTQAVLSYPRGVMGTELGSSARTVHALNHRAICPASLEGFKYAALRTCFLAGDTCHSTYGDEDTSTGQFFPFSQGDNSGRQIRQEAPLLAGPRFN